MTGTSNLSRTTAARFSATTRASGDTSLKFLRWPLSSSKPAKCQPMVPFSSATTGLGTPAFINDCAPIILRVRPAQLTTTVVSGFGARSCILYASSAPGTSIPLGMFILWYSLKGRLSSTTMSSPFAVFVARSAAEMWGVPAFASTNSPNALLGTCTPENNS